MLLLKSLVPLARKLWWPSLNCWSSEFSATGQWFPSMKHQLVLKLQLFTNDLLQLALKLLHTAWVIIVKLVNTLLYHRYNPYPVPCINCMCIFPFFAMHTTRHIFLLLLLFPFGRERDGEGKGYSLNRESLMQGEGPRPTTGLFMRIEQRKITPP